MLTCEVCGEELVLEEDMKTHLLLSHPENDMGCTLCSWSGVANDELHFHINTTHKEEQGHDGGGAEGRGGHSLVRPSSSPTLTTTIVDNHSKQAIGLSRSEGSERGVDNGNRFDTIGGGVSPRTSNSTLESKEKITEAGGEFGGGRAVAIVVSTSSVSTGFLRSAQDSSRPTSRHCNAEESVGVGSAEHTKVKQKRFSSPLKEKRFSCPMCALVCTDAFILQEHVELHLLEESPAEEAVLGATSSTEAASSSNSSGGKSYECPLCSVVCGDCYSLQEHVELHLDYGTATSAVSPGSDLRLARRLQEEEKQRRKEQEAKREAEEFKKLQRQFGVDGRGGYRKQMERTVEKAVSRGVMVPAHFHNKRDEMMEALASGVDDGRTRTQGVLGALYVYYQREARDCVHVWLSADTDHYCSSEGDKGWGCGYRNFQMLLSSLQRMEPYTTCLSEGSVPSIPQVQVLIEGAWREGLDPQGATHFNQRLQGTRAWIGATEIYALCTSLRVSARVLDFHQPTGPGDTHPRLFDWVKQYFSQTATRGARLPPRVVQTTQPPLYLQHQGHSRSIVGVEQKKNGSLCLLLLDPGCTPGDVRKLLSQDGSTVSTAVCRMRKFPGNLKHRQYQVVAVEGVLAPVEKQTRILNSRTLQAERIP
ncbi:zinc finger-containing ubiquitin peptidase 1 isoform X1 [Oncorhynchus tshawytscha]|uniref:Zinc finger-containing ubiquitin peptidase 1 n=1 Tax=Oncorhynchus tshawytscha TaxID=74940 RepID=A0A8C8JD54_ONCTS|nr:zinc finger-containing ubiquitin peptidase 1 isoform X1 [Oncorhynchus tshawytscha]XP_024248508.1 zinc finger-containing ubiquitin peptidase 1 isoform X1 [Oncorhynchus tshawytscha]